MPAQANGRAKTPKAAGSNGHLNGHLNGHANGHVDVKKQSGALVRPARARKPSRSITGSFFNAVTRIISWYMLITTIFRCPSSISKLSDASPPICRPYLQARSYATPYLDPYYQAYVAPQVEKAQPYIDTINTRVYTPVAGFTKSQYSKYGAHRVEQAHHFLESQWDKTARPQLDKARARAQQKYSQHVAPYVTKASGIVTPHYQNLKHSFGEIYHTTVLPAYNAILPYSKTAYAHGHHIVAHVIFPHVRSGRDSAWAFVSRTLWPQLRILYADNVEPQLVRISERLGRYRDSKKLEAYASSVDSSSVSSMSSSSSVPTIVDSDSAAKLLSDIWADEPQTSQSGSQEATASDPSSPPQPSLSESELREKLNNDLRQWQTKFATAADKGAEDLEERVAEITKRQVESGVRGHGAALLTQLEETVTSTIEKFKTFIKKTAAEVPEDATEEQLESAYEKCVAQSRALGIQVKEKAQAVRSWKTKYDEETDHLVKSAVDNTLAVLQRIHDLGLQEVGLRWAWTDGVTYQDWQNYHKLKDTLTEWEGEVAAVGAAHDGLRVAHEESKKLEDDAMATASKMVHELIRLKEVARWKIWAADSSDDFSDKKMPVRPLKAAQEIVKNVGEAVSKASESVVSTAKQAAESVVSAMPQELVESSQPASEPSSEQGKSAGSQTVTKEVIEESISSVASAVETTPTTKEVSSFDPPRNGVSLEPAGENKGASIDADRQAHGSHKASRVPKKVFGGAMAAEVPDVRKIIFDDEIEESDNTYSERIQSILSGAGDRAAELTKAVSEALLNRQSTQNSVESMTSLASEQYARALAAASSAIYGTPQPAVESMTSAAAERFSQAVTAASYAIYGTPTPTAVIQSIRIQASSQYDNAVEQARQQYSKALSQLSEKVSGTPTPAHQQLWSSVEKAYSDSLAAASAQLQSALKYTDSAKSYVSGPTQGVFESVSSVAASKLSEGLSLASAQFTAQPTPALADARRRYYDAIGAAHARYAEFLDTASSAINGPQQGRAESIASVVSKSAESLASQVSSSVIGSETPWAESIASQAASLASEASSSIIGSETPWTESVASQASQNWEALISKASLQVYGPPTPFAESVYSRAGAYGAEATAQAGSAYSNVAAYGAQATAQAIEQFGAVQALISELVIGKEPDFTESVMNRLSSAYYTGYPAAMSSASSYASENFEAASSYASENYEAASSVITSLFTPPPAVENIINSANEQINAAVESVSIQIYGTSKGPVEQATESAASVYSSIQSKASEAIYGAPQAQSQYFIDIAASAQAAMSEAIFGAPTPSGYVASATSGAASAYQSAASVASEKASAGASAVSSAVSSVVYGPEQGALESASSRLAASVAAANSRINEMLASASKSAAAAANSASSVMSERMRDEL